MTKEQAQKIVNNQGFAWTVTEVVEGDAFNMIYCEWKGKEHLMYYSNNQNKICRIKQYNKTIISIRFKRFFVRLEKIGKSDIININKGSESE